jgi:hypothetical protein
MNNDTHSKIDHTIRKDKAEIDNLLLEISRFHLQAVLSLNLLVDS